MTLQTPLDSATDQSAHEQEADLRERSLAHGLFELNDMNARIQALEKRVARTTVVAWVAAAFAVFATVVGLSPVVMTLFMAQWMF